MQLRHTIPNEFLSAISSQDAVFHYTKKSTALEKILYADLFKLSSLAATNDPYEYNMKITGAHGWGGMPEIPIADKVDDHIKQLLEQNTSFISCCSNVFDGALLKCLGCLKPRMWSQYGENHEGVCLVFSKKKLFELINANCPFDKYLVAEGAIDYKVYVNDDSEQDSIPINNDTKDAPIDIAINHIVTHKKELLFRKQQDYSGEDEYRIITLRKEYPSSLFDIPEFKVSKCLIGIILGDRFPESYIPSINDISEKFNLPYRRLSWIEGEYFLFPK